MKTSLGVALACLVASTGAVAQQMARHLMVFKGPQGVEAVVAPVEGDKEALVRLSGINNPVDGVVFLARAAQRGAGGQAWITVLDGRDFGLVHKQGSGYGGERYQAYLPGRRDPVPLHYDEHESKRLAPNELKAIYTRQQQDGVQQKLARFDRDQRVAQIGAGLEEIDATATRACGAPVKTAVDWTSISEDQLKRLSIQGYCGTVASELGTMCGSDAAFKPKATALGRINCRFGPELKLRTEGGALVFTTREGAPNQGEFARQFLRNQ